MYDFIIGLAVGTFLTRIFTKKHKRDVTTQVDFVSFTTEPVKIPRKKFVPGSLANFWG
jgi:uncharacterized membrane-anchored protein YhcB (DUF1043 family)